MTYNVFGGTLNLTLPPPFVSCELVVVVSGCRTAMLVTMWYCSFEVCAKYSYVDC